MLSNIIFALVSRYESFVEFLVCSYIDNFFTTKDTVSFILSYLPLLEMHRSVETDEIAETQYSN